jgi:NAD(P)-dependent dehydrogenase (short-subunit alcohol dehydrogenase family)
MKSFRGKVAAITGAGSGMGRSLAVTLARRGCEVAISDIDERSLAETAGLVKGMADVRVTRRRLDVADRDAVYAWADEVVRDHGGCNLIFNNAGVSYAATVEGANDHDFERIMAIDFWGVVHGTRAFLPHLKASGDGHVVNTSSVFGLLAAPGQCTYNSAKFAVRGFTEALRIELEITGAPVGASCVHPGGIKTNIARASKMDPSMHALGIDDLAAASRRFERSFRTTADEAAEIILRGVEKNARRILVGTDAHIIDLFQRLIPSHYHGVVARLHQRIVGNPRKGVSATPKPADAPPREHAQGKLRPDLRN